MKAFKKAFNKINDTYNKTIKKTELNKFLTGNILLFVLATFTIVFFTIGIINNNTSINQLNEADFSPVPITEKETFALNVDKVKQIDYILIKVGNYGKKINSRYKFIFYKNNKKIYSKTVDVRKIKNNDNLNFKVNINTNQSDKYTVTIVPLDTNDNNKLAVFSNSKNVIYSSYERKSSNTIFCLIIYFLTIVIFFIINHLIKSKKYSIEKVYLSFAAYFVIIAFIIPPFHAPDEFYHFTQSYGLSENFFSKETIKYPSNYECLLYGHESNNVYNTNDIYKCLISKKSKKTMLYDTRLQAHNIAHIIISIPIRLVRLFTSSPIVIFFIGRFMNLVLNLIILYMALKLLPFGKKNLLLIIAIPVLIQQFTTYSYDGLANSISILLVSYILNLTFVKQKTTTKDYLIISLLLFLLMNIKIPYAMLGAPLLLVPKDKYNNSVIRKYFITLLIIISSFIAYKVFNGIVSVNDSIVGGLSSNSIITLITNPIYTLKLFKNTIFTNLKFYIITMIGGLDWLNVYMSNFYINLIIVMLIVLLFGGGNKINKWGRFFYLVISVIIFIGILVALYISWTDPNSSIITGVQGRYFLPLLLPLTMTFLTKKEYIKISDQFVEKLSNIIIVAYLFTILIAYY